MAFHAKRSNSSSLAASVNAHDLVLMTEIANRSNDLASIALRFVLNSLLLFGRNLSVRRHHHHHHHHRLLSAFHATHRLDVFPQIELLQLTNNNLFLLGLEYDKIKLHTGANDLVVENCFVIVAAWCSG